MRTTVTLDPDVAAKLKARVRETGAPFKRVLNDVLRRGLGDGGRSAAYRVPVRRLRAQPGVDLDRALRLADSIDDAATTRRRTRA